LAFLRALSAAKVSHGFPLLGTQHYGSIWHSPTESFKEIRLAREDLLFYGTDWFSIDRNQRQQMVHEIEQVNGDRLLNTSPDDLAKFFAGKYQIIAPQLDVDSLTVDQREAKIDVSHDRMRYFSDDNGPHYVTGSEIEVEIPFHGEADAFQIKPSSYTLNPPRATIRNSKVVFKVVGTNLQSDVVKGEIDSTIASIQGYLTTLESDIHGLNSQLLDVACQAIERRRIKLLADRNVVSSLGFKMKEREGAVRTYVAPEVRRKITPVMPQASSAPFKPEPALSSSDYEHILEVMQNMTMVMERSPSAFHAVDEEALRSHFLVQLNGHYQGQASGETFNYEGKTDILVRSDGKNIFIGECKFWSGTKKLTETLDQLLGYSSWRDTKTAVVIFNRNRDFSNVLAQIPATVRSHPNYKRDLPGSTETSFKFVFANRDDRNREMIVTVVAFDVPTASS
jgi:hypothetical protein